MKQLIIFLFLSTSALFPFTVHADAEITKAVIDKAIEGGFSELEKQVIEKYFKNEKNSSEEETYSSKDKKKNKKKDLPAGLAKKEKLPPGLAMQLERNGTLPPGLAKRNLPSNLEAELPDPIEGLERTIVDQSVVLVEKATGRIVDILKDIVTGN